MFKVCEALPMLDSILAEEVTKMKESHPALFFVLEAQCLVRVVQAFERSFEDRSLRTEDCFLTILDNYVVLQFKQGFLKVGDIAGCFYNNEEGRFVWFDARLDRHECAINENIASDMVQLVLDAKYVKKCIKKELEDKYVSVSSDGWIKEYKI